MTDVILNKLQTVRRCLLRIDEEYAGDFANLENVTKQDAIILNLQRACEASISLAMHIVSRKNIGVPQNSREAFTMLAGFCRPCKADESYGGIQEYCIP